MFTGGVAVLLFSAWWGIDLWRDNQQLEVARAVSILPPGVEGEWTGYMDRQLDRVVQPAGAMAKVVSVAGRTFVSRDQPFTVLCPGNVAILTFGHGDAGIIAFVYGFGHAGDPGDPPPRLGVHPESVAAKQLWGRLCDHVADRLQAIMTAPSPLPDPPPLPHS